MASGNAKGGVAKAAVVVLGGLGLAVLASFFLRSGDPGQPAALVSAPAEPAPQVDERADLPRLTIDNWRVEADGAGLISGRAVAVAQISVLLDGADVAFGTATPAGDYVILFNLAPNDQPSLLTLRAVLPDGTALAAPEAIALAPNPGPVLAAARPSEAPQDPESPQVAKQDQAAPAPQPEVPTAVLVTDAGAKVVADATGAAAGSPAALTIAAIAYTPDDQVQLSGTGGPGQVVRLYLDNQQVAEAPVLPDASWQTLLGGIVPGVYTLRADQIDDTGKVTARFETPFKRETPEALAALTQPKAKAAAAPPEPTEGDAPARAEPAAPTPDTAPALAEVAGDTAAEGASVPAEITAAPEPGRVATNPPPPAAPQPVAATPGAATPAPTLAEPAAEAVPGAVPQTVSITVQPGFSLWRIARDTYGDGVLYVQVFEANKDKIGDPDLIYPGQVFELPRP
ncbi:LysM peptidoglycan-binding domain-containing protein [Pseudotabrizicola sp. L79]|uniref:LysM peptidoglycan-binding domain-containing protein n=1 Tax=Pseudotabrizicola sp. L79 TaxID=3118402 RepID=UPI002F924A5C